jgi:hypothetical protein
MFNTPIRFMQASRLFAAECANCGDDTNNYDRDLEAFACSSRCASRLGEDKRDELRHAASLRRC